MKMYVIQRRNFEYNDETYNCTDGGNAVRAYNTLEAANDAVVAMTVNELKEGRFYYYYDTSVDDFSDEAIKLFLGHGVDIERSYISYGECEDISDSMARGDYTDEELHIIAYGLPSWKSLYFVEEVEAD